MTKSAALNTEPATPTLSDELKRLSDHLNRGVRVTTEDLRRASACLYVASEIVGEHAADVPIPSPPPLRPVDTAERLPEDKWPLLGETWQTSMGPATVTRVDPKGRYFPVNVTLPNGNSFDCLCLSPESILSGKQFRLKKAPKNG